MSYFKKLLLLIVFGFIFLGGRYVTLVNADTHKVSVCHTGNGTNWISVSVDKNAWDTHTSAHSSHQQDFLVDEEHSCPPEGGKPITTCDIDLPDELLVVDATRNIVNSPDSGENSNFWAKDTFTQRMRIWEVKYGHGNSQVHFFCGQTDDNGTFDAIAGQESPGINSPVTLNGSEDGTFYGGTRVKISGGFDPSWATSGNVGTFNFDIPAEKIGYSTHPNWIDKYFEENSFDWVSWNWHYKSCGHGAWNNSSAGNSGDIVPGPTGEVCGQTPAPSSEPQPQTQTQSSTSTGPSQCTAQKPPKPGTLTAEKTSPTTVKLTWSAVAPVTYYAISYGTDPNNFQFGVPNVGNSTSFVVGALNPNLKYYFKVIAVNDCMPSDPTAEVSPGGILGASTEKVLGASTDRLAATDSNLYLPRIMAAAVFFVLSLTSGVKFLHGSKKS